MEVNAYKVFSRKVKFLKIVIKIILIDLTGNYICQIII